MHAIDEIRAARFCGCSLTTNGCESYPDPLISDPDSWAHLMLHGSSFDSLADELENSLLADRN